MACSACGKQCGGTCNVCSENPCESCCNQPCIRWGFDDCYLRGRCADGTELDPLNLCTWLKAHETCTEFRLVPQTDGDSYMEFINECDASQKIYICDFLGLSRLECLGNVNDEDPNSCDLLVFDPCCGSKCGTGAGKWTHYSIPRWNETDCILEVDDEGYHHVLSLNDCGCIEECRMFSQTFTWEWTLRDSWPDDPDWPFSMGSRLAKNGDAEVIDLMLDKKCPMWGKSDLEVTFQYTYGIQNTDTDGLPVSTLLAAGNHNFKSICTPQYSDAQTPNTSDVATNAVVVQASNLVPMGSWESQVSKTVVVPKGKKLYLNHQIEMRDSSTHLVDTFWGESTSPNHDSSRLHALHVFVRAVRGVIVPVSKSEMETANKRTKS